MSETRVTDAIEFFRQREEHGRAVAVLRERRPDALRWRKATARLSTSIGALQGRGRVRAEEPLREVVLDLRDAELRREVVLDARRGRVDLDRGEVLAPKSYGDLRRVAFLVSAELRLVTQHVPVVEDFFAPIDVAGVVVVGRSLAEAYAKRARRLCLELPLGAGEERMATRRELGLLEQIRRDDEDARRWLKLSEALLAPT